MDTIEIRRSTLSSPDAATLIAALNAELKALFPEPGATHFSLTEEQVGDGAFLIAYLDEVAVGCGAVRRMDHAGTSGEIKRMYVDPAVRRQGIARRIVDALEAEARELGMTRLVLETGTRLEAAIRLYKAMGYIRIPLFGEYFASPDTSLCFAKLLE